LLFLYFFFFFFFNRHHLISLIPIYIITLLVDLVQSNFSEMLENEI
jgi:hypothetical protein